MIDIRFCYQILRGVVLALKLWFGTEELTAGAWQVGGHQAGGWNGQGGLEQGPALCRETGELWAKPCAEAPPEAAGLSLSAFTASPSPGAPHSWAIKGLTAWVRGAGSMIMAAL